MADLINFVSKREIDAKKEQRRQARESILAKAKDDYYKEQRRKERKKETGEGSWMLPSLSQKLEEDDIISKDKSSRKKHKKEKKQKKNKKEKKHKKTKQDILQCSASSESESDDEWVEKGGANISTTVVPSKTNQLQRDRWMLCPPISCDVDAREPGLEDLDKGVEEDNKDKEKKLSCMDQPGQHSRELNPYWKDGGTGLPSESKLVQKAVDTTETSSFDSKWLKKAYQRAKEQAEEEARSVDAVVAERWGSLERLESMIMEAEQREARQDRETSRSSENERYRGEYSRRDERRRRDREERQWSNRYDGHPRERAAYRETDQERRKRRMVDERIEENTNTEVKKFLKPSYKDDRKYLKPPDNEGKKFLKPADTDNRSPFAGKFLRPPSPTSTSASTTASVHSNPGLRRPDLYPQGTSSSSSGGWRKKTAADTEPEPGSASRGAENTKSTHMLRKMETSSSSDSSSSCSEAEDVEEEGKKQAAIPIKKITEADLNEIGAKIVKAEIMGDEDQAAKLKSQLDEMRRNKELQEAKAAAKGRGKREDSEEEVILTRTDAAGNIRPLEMVSRPEPKGKRRKRQKVDTHSKEGKRERYFADDDRYDIKEMVRREKMHTAEDHNAMLARLSSKSAASATSDDFTLDDHFVSSAASKLAPAQLEERERQKAIKEHRQLAAQLAKCRFCFENPDIAKHLIIAIGIKVYLALPLHESLTEGHCLLIPMQHCSASTLLDEDVWSEIQIYKKGLTKMFEEMDQDVIFLETCKQLKKQHHLIIECIPLPRETGDLAPVYFKKAILESDTEWAQNKRLIDTKKKGLRASIPRGLPYFSVEFGLDGGFAHVIEEEDLFPHYFGKEIVGGMLDLEPHRWRKPRRENFEVHKKKVLNFADWWKPFDWTRKLDRKTN